MAARRSTGAEQWSASEAAFSAPAETAAPSTVTDIKWPHMVDNLLLGLAALLAAHWLATTLPESNRAVFRLVALVVALPFGFQFERNSRSGSVDPQTTYTGAAESCESSRKSVARATVLALTYRTRQNPSNQVRRDWATFSPH